MSTNKFLDVAGLEKVAAKINNVDTKTVKMVETTWAELKALRDGGKLIPGMQYRITDYECTTTTTLTHSAGHVFDIIVTADSPSVLNENARACKHEGDTYFANLRLEVWELKYCLDNDVNKFAWADATNGKGVVYFLKDEFGNECSYDFKNIIYDFPMSFKYDRWGRIYTFIRDESLDEDGYYGWRNSDGTNPIAWNQNYCYTTTEAGSSSTQMYLDTSGTVVSDSNTYSWNTTAASYYTFNYFEHDQCRDGSIPVVSMGQTYCVSDNRIALAYTSRTRILNMTIFTATTYSKLSNTYDNTIAEGNYNNFFHMPVFNNVIGFDFHNNNCGSDNSNRPFSNNVIGNSCSDNKIYIMDNSTLGNSVKYCKINPRFYYGKIGNGCEYLDLTQEGTGDFLFAYSTIDDGVKYIHIQRSGSSSPSAEYRYIHIHRGVKGSSSSDLLTVTVLNNQDYEANIVADGTTDTII